MTFPKVEVLQPVRVLCLLGLGIILVLCFRVDISTTLVNVRPFQGTPEDTLQAKDAEGGIVYDSLSENATLEVVLTRLRDDVAHLEGGLVSSGGLPGDGASAELAAELAAIARRLGALSEGLANGTLAKGSAMLEDVANGGAGKSTPVSKARGCILQMHTAAALSAPNGTNSSEGWASGLMYYATTPLMNRMYAERHGYRYIYSDGSDVADKERSRSWWKVRLLRNSLARECDWALWLDSDVYLRMEEHSLSMEQLMERLASNWTGPFEDGTRQSYIGSDPRTLLNPDIKGEDGALAMFPRNGDRKGGYYARMMLNPTRDYVCAGIQLWKNSSLTLQIMDDWYNNAPNHLYRVRTLEQRGLNEHIIPTYLKHMVIVPYGMFSSQEIRPQQRKAQMARHIWSAVYAKYGPDYRDAEMRNALLSFYILRDLESHKGPGSNEVREEDVPGAPGGTPDVADEAKVAAYEADALANEAGGEEGIASERPTAEGPVAEGPGVEGPIAEGPVASEPNL